MRVDRRDEDLAHLLSQAERRVTERLSARLEAEGLTLAQWRVLIYSAARGRRLHQRLTRELDPAVRVLGDVDDGQDAAHLARLLLRILELPR